MSIAGRTGLAVAVASVGPLLCLGLWLAIEFGPDVTRVALPVAVCMVLGLASASIVAKMAMVDLRRGLRLVTRYAWRVSAGQRLPDQVEELPSELGELADLLVAIDRRAERLESALEHLEVRAGVELGRRSNEVQALQEQTAHWQAEAATLYRFAAAINQTVDAAQICGQLVTYVEESVRYKVAVAYLVDPSNHELAPVLISDLLVPVRQIGYHLRELQASQQLPDYGERNAVTWVAQTQKPLRVDEHTNNRFRRWLRSDLRSLLVAPLVVGDQTRGIVAFADTEPDRFTNEDERVLLALAHQAAMALENARLLEEAAKVEALRELDRLKSELLSNVSHELRTPLASIKGYAETLLRDDVEWTDEDRKEFLTTIDEESEHLQALIEDLLQMSHIEAGQLQIHREPVALRKLAQAVARKARIQASQHAISVSFPSGVPLVHADPKRIRQVMTNLVANAIKYSPEGGNVRVRGLVARIGPDNRVDYQSTEPTHVVVAIADEGIGIPEDDANRVFDRFYRVHNSRTRETRGSGLGLAISKGIVDAHGGTIWVESPGVVVRAGQPGRGSTFYFSLPICDQSTDDTDDELEPSDETRSE